MKQYWFTSVNINMWDHISKNANDYEYKYKLDSGDQICFYVIGTSDIKGVAERNSEGVLKFTHVGNVNFFRISNNLKFIKNNKKNLEYLKNYDGFANYGNPINYEDMSTIITHISKNDKKNIYNDENSRICQGYVVLYKLENTLRYIVNEELTKKSSTWIKQVSDKKMIEEWKGRMEVHNKSIPENEKITDIMAFSDLDDLKMLIINRSNWKLYFENIFKSKSHFESAFTVFQDIRRDIAHSRQISDGNLLLFDKHAAKIHEYINDFNRD